VDLILGLPYGPAANSCRIRGRTHGSNRLRDRPILKFFLHRGGRPHMPVWDRRPASLSERRAPAQPGHFRRNGGLIDEYQVFRIKVRLCVEPGLAPGGDVGPFLFARVRCFF
jgi:hypothetical protein